MKTSVCAACGVIFTKPNANQCCSRACASALRYPPENLAGRRFNHLLVVSRNLDESWDVVCDCGNTKSMCSQAIKRAKSCTAFCCVPRVDKNVAKRRWTEENRDKVREQHARFVRDNPDKPAGYNKKWEQANQEAMRAARAVYNALPTTKKYYRDRARAERDTLSDRYVIRQVMGIRLQDLPVEILPGLISLKRLQIQAQRLCRENKEKPHGH